MVCTEQLVQLPGIREVKWNSAHRNLKQDRHLCHLSEQLGGCPTFTSANVQKTHF